MLLERERELESLSDLVDDARAQRGGVAIVEGEAGIGKTSLLEETAARASANGLRVLRARGTALEHEFGFGVVRQLFERVVLQASDDERGALLAGAAGLATPALGIATSGDRPAGDAAAFAVQHGLYWFACNLAERAPLVLLVDDAQ
jgi:predicted ATPase